MHEVNAMIVGRKDHPLHRGTGNINAPILQCDSGEFRPATGIEIACFQGGDDAGWGQ